jgi:Cell division protein FtsI/penicillin-binding protein 2
VPKSVYLQSVTQYYRLQQLFWLIYVLLALLLVRLAYLQIIHHQHFQMLSQKNQLSMLPIDAPRGLIEDRHGIVLARKHSHL